MPKRKKISKIISIRLPVEIIETLDKIVEEQGFRDRTALLKYMIIYCTINKCYEKTQIIIT